MISEELAGALRDAGFEWQPASGDRFVIPGRDLDGEVFHISEMTIEAHDVPGGRLIKFNGTTEWALDSIPASEVLWMPSEGQLRAALGRRFDRLETLGDGFVVVLDDGRREADIDAERAYARALLTLLRD